MDYLNALACGSCGYNINLMSARFQSWLLRNTSSLQYLVNERLAKRSGVIGRMARALEMGERQYSQHTLLRAFKVANWLWVYTYQWMGMMRPIASRFMGSQNGPLNYSGIGVYIFCTAMVFSRFRFIRSRDVLWFNQQDNPEFWYARYNMMFPPNFLHNRLSAHYIEINHIFSIEMMKKYQGARREILAEREQHSEEVRRTKYASNPNYVYEPFGSDDVGSIKQLKENGTF